MLLIGVLFLFRRSKNIIRFTVLNIFFYFWLINWTLIGCKE